MPRSLPIDALCAAFETALRDGPVVISSPTGSGKSTLVPRWCPGRVLVVEPRRVACRSLAQRVAALEGTPLGDDVGYQVRDERRAGRHTRILFATPGVVLRQFATIERYDTVVLDELHERSLEVDLLLALLKARFGGHLVAMSATLDGEGVASHLGGRHLHAAGRAHPVDISHRADKALLPTTQGLEARVAGAVAASRAHPGDVLVFLPGKGEIAACARALGGDPELEVLALHGGLNLEAQSRAFQPAQRRKVILATNVAETSITVPGIGVVIDTGLVRQTRYHRDRGYLTLVPIACDSADQRAGRAGRTTAGVAFRLWSPDAQLAARTLPAVHRESLVPLVLAAAACGAQAATLPFLDPPPDHALQTARRELEQLGALNPDGGISERGRQLFGLPLDVSLGRLLVEAEARDHSAPGLLDDAIDLVAGLATGRPLHTAPRPQETADLDEPQAVRCDAVALIQALRGTPPPSAAAAHDEARHVRSRLRQALGRPAAKAGRASAEVDRQRLAMAVLAADPRAAHVARQRGRRVAWSNGGTELELGRHSRVQEAEHVEAIAVLETRALGLGGRETRLIATCAMPLPLGWLHEAGLGRDRLAAPTLTDERLVARIERVYAQRVLAVREDVPRGKLARQALTRLFLDGAIFPASLETTRHRLQAAALAQRLGGGERQAWGEAVAACYSSAVPTLEVWVSDRLAALGFENGDDLPLLSPADLLAPALPAWLEKELDRSFPRTLKIAGTHYELDYDLRRNEVTVRQTTGKRPDPPPLLYLPPWRGLRVRFAHRDTTRMLRP